MADESHLGGNTSNTPNWGDGGTWGEEIWDKIIIDCSIKSVVDIGCGKGYSTKYFESKGLKSIGIEGLTDNVSNKVCSTMIHHDYVNGSALIDHNYFYFDLVWCCEFVEHVEEQYCDNFLQDFAHAKYIAMTFAVPKQEGYHHVNCQPKEYWVEKIEKLGFVFDEIYSKELQELAKVYQLATSFAHAGHLTKLLFFKKII